MRSCVADADDATMDLWGGRRSPHGRARCTTNLRLRGRHNRARCTTNLRLRGRHNRARCTTNLFLPSRPVRACRRYHASRRLEGAEPCPVSDAIALSVYVDGDVVYSGEALEHVRCTDRSLVGQPQPRSERVGADRSAYLVGAPHQPRLRLAHLAEIWKVPQDV